MESADAPPISAARTSYLFDEYRINVHSLELLRSGHPVPLTPKTFDTLLLLIRNRHRVVGKDELLRTVWHETVVSDDSLSQCISTLRKALDDDAAEPKFVATLPRRGYRFIAPVTEVAHDDMAPPQAARPTSDSPVTAPVNREPTGATPAARTDGTWARRMAMAGAALLALGIAIGFGLFTMLRPGPPRPLRLNVQVPAGTTLGSGAILSPDGALVAFVAEDGGSGHSRLWVDSLQSGEPRPLAGTEGAQQPFWSPDSRFVGFFAAGVLKKVGVASGPPQSLATLGIVPAGASWGPDGTILFAAFRSSINAVADSGGAITAVTSIDRSHGDLAHEWPSFLPDGKRFLFSIDSSNANRGGTYVGFLDGTPPRRVLPDHQAIYASPGYLLYVRDRTLLAQPFDEDTLRVDSTPTMVAGGVSAPSVRNGAKISVARELLVFGGAMGAGRLLWIDRAGQKTDVANAPVDLHNPAPVPVRNQVLLDGGAVWLFDPQRGTTTRLIGDGSTPVASPDGSQVVFDAVRESGVADLYVREIDGTHDALLLHSSENKLANDWTRDGRYVVFVSRNPKTGRDIWLLPMEGERTPVAFATGPGNEIQAQVSPDGRWIAYASDESGTWQVYVQSFPSGGNKRAVSAGGGGKPQWRADGRELYYLAADRMLMSAAVSASGEIARAEPLFQAPVAADLGTYRTQFLPAPDGERFLVDAADASGGREPVTVLVNWTALLPP